MELRTTEVALPEYAGYSSSYKPLSVIYAITLPQYKLPLIIPVEHALPFGLGRQTRHNQAICLPVARNETVRHVEYCCDQFEQMNVVSTLIVCTVLDEPYILVKSTHPESEAISSTIVVSCCVVDTLFPEHRHVEHNRFVSNLSDSQCCHYKAQVGCV